MKKCLQLAKKHPRNAFKVGKHTITRKPQEFELSKEDESELKSKGCKVWIKEGVMPKKKAPAKKDK